MAKIAVIDLLFHWPPDGGSRVDLKEIFTRISKYHSVTFFVPEFLRYYPRGEILSPVDGIDIELIKFNPLTYNFFQVPLRIKRAVDKFKPDFVFIADGELIKPYVVDAMREYKPIVRYYSYDSFCIKDYGTLFRDKKICSRCYLDTPFYCLKCSLAWVLKWHPRNATHTFFTSLAFTPLLYRAFKRGLSSAGGVIVYNNYIAEMVKKVNKKCYVVPSGVDTSLFTPKEKNSRNDKFTILMSGRVNDYGKGFHILYKACKKLYRKGYNIEVLITGEKTVDDDFVKSAGWLNPEELPSLYSKADVSVVPSIWMEPFGIVAVESLACGIPVIASNTGGLATIVEDGETGILFKTGDEDELSNAIEKLINDRKLLQKMGEKARMSAVKRFDWDMIVKNHYLHLFEK
ncbi:MAG: glycosyltransferase family 1 protein [Candidatus Schekmanbacteria bacterium]|nr:MAG: glycosyltransferase family 1 protein [Candidatus Schekmanbacteria bacterium]